MSKTYYMHTINGFPGIFSDGQICYAAYYGKPNRLQASLKDIRKQQRQSRKYRESKGWFDRFDYNHIRVEGPDDD